MSGSEQEPVAIPGLLGFRRGCRLDRPVSGRVVGHSENGAGTTTFGLAVGFLWTALCTNIGSY